MLFFMFFCILVYFLFFFLFFFFFNDTATTEIYTLSLHDALPLFQRRADSPSGPHDRPGDDGSPDAGHECARRSEEHTSELQSLTNLVCRLLLEKKKKLQNQLLLFKKKKKKKK